MITWNDSLYLIYHEIQITIKQDSYTKAYESGEEAQKETMRLIDIGLPQSKNKVNTVIVTVRPFSLYETE